MSTALEVHRYDQLLASGISGRRIRNDVNSGVLVRIRPGVFVIGAAWTEAKPETRIIARARALQLTSRDRPVLSHETAAARHGLPLYRAGDRVHVIASVERPGAAWGVVRHRGELGDDIVEIDGMLCTSLARTVADTARTMAFDQAVTIADAAMRTLCVERPGEYDVAGAAEFRATAREIARRSAHGITRADRALDFADGRAQLPGESISRIRLRQLGFRRIALQVRVDAPDGSDYFVDFGLEEARSLGEFDGSIKYVDGRMLDGRTTAEAFDTEKQREDWIRGVTGRIVVRWGWPHIASARTLGSRLSAFGVRPPG